MPNRPMPDAVQLRRMTPAAIGTMLLPLILENSYNQTRGFVPVDFAIGVADRCYPAEQRINHETDEPSISDLLMEGLAFLQRSGLLVPKTFQGVGKGDWFKLSRDGVDLAKRAPTELVTIGSITAEKLLHPKIAAVALPEIDRGPDGYPDAIFKAFREVEKFTREAGSLDTTDVGVKLMNKAFGPTGPLADQSLQDPAEQDAIRSVFAGAIGAFKNPGSHRSVDEDNPSQVMRMLIFASALMEIIERNRPF